MIECTFENSKKGNLRHATVGSILLNKTRDKFLLVKRADNSMYEPGKFDIPGGFMELNETTQQTALREIKEETGYDAKIVTLFCINDNPNLNPIQNVEFIYLAEIEERTGESDHEIDTILWFSLDDVPDAYEFAFNRFQDIDLYKKYMNQQFTLPIIK